MTGSRASFSNLVFTRQAAIKNHITMCEKVIFRNRLKHFFLPDFGLFLPL